MSGVRILNVGDLLTATQAKVTGIAPSQGVFLNGIYTDSRKPLADAVFVALKGVTFDGHDHALQAKASGTRHFMVHRPIEGLEDCTQFMVKDTLQALQDLAKFMRKKWNPYVIGITGSNGKTTTKESLQWLLTGTYISYCNRGSLNNHWGLPITILEFPQGPSHLILEMGMNHSGEIRELVEIADPDMVLVTMVGHAHIEHFETRDKIAEAKSEIYRYSRPQAIGIYNIDNEFTREMYIHMHKTKSLTFSETMDKADVCLSVIRADLQGLIVQGRIGERRDSTHIPLLGAHNITNILAASAAALAAGVNENIIWERLAGLPSSWGRNQLIKTSSKAEILFDAYNANPDSMKALLQNVRSMCTHRLPRIGVFAQMRELGASSRQSHIELGQHVAQSGFEIVWFYGDDWESFQEGFGHPDQTKKLFVSPDYQEDVARKISAMLESGDLVVVKGSRGMKLERFVQVCSPLNFEGK